MFFKSEKIYQIEKEKQDLRTEIEHLLLEIDHLKQQRAEQESLLLDANVVYDRLEQLEKNCSCTDNF